jgi:predicted O-methyltransferase YrrM
MSLRSIGLSEAVHGYLCEATLREPALLKQLRDETAQLPQANMQIAPEQGQFMALLTELLDARRVLEVGVFTGYSSLSVALALPDDGHLVACDISEEWTRIARRYWEQAGVAHKIDLRLGPGVASLDALLANGEASTYDFAFLDADKESYVAYKDQCLELIRPGGLLAFDNALWNGDVADPQKTDAATEAIRDVTRQLRDDPRVSLSLVPIGDGLLLARKR